MNYKKQYVKLIRNAQNNNLPTLPIDGINKKIYTEKHHIFPKSIFGKNNLIVKLTPKEHFVAHHLLWKYYQKKYGNDDNKTMRMRYAFWSMNHGSKYNFRINLKIYEKLRKDFIDSITGPNHPLFGKYRTEEVRKQISEKHLGKHSGEKNHMFGKKGLNSPNFGKKRIEHSKFMSENNPSKLASVKQKRRQARLGTHLSEETKNKLSKSKIGKYAGKNHPRYKGKLQRIDKKTGEIKEYADTAEAIKDGFEATSISACSNGRRKTHKGFYWRYYNG